MHQGAGSAQPPELVPVSGSTEGAFEDVRESFTRLVAAQGGGAALSIVHHGRTVVDLVGGDYAPDALQVLFSVSKAFAAVAAAHAAEAGLLDLDAPLGSYWPAFDRHGTADITARMVLSHRSGLAALDATMSLEQLLAHDDELAIESQEPYWTPGSAHGYHAFTFGTLVNGIFRHTAGTSVGAYFEALARPRGWELWLGVPDSVRDRIAPILYRRPRISAARLQHVGMSPIPAASTGVIARTIDLYNQPEFHGADWPSASGVGSARSLAAFFAATLDGSVISPESLATMIATQARGFDVVLGLPMHYGSGMQLEFPVFPMLGPGSFGHEGAGGSAAFADTAFDAAVGFTTDTYPSVMGASPVLLALLPTIRKCLVEADAR